MMSLPLRLVKHLREGLRIVAQLEVGASDRFAFVGVHPFRREDSAPWSYRVRRFEIDKSLVGYDLWEGALEKEETREFDSLEELDALLGEWVGDPSLFQDSSENSNYPF